MSIGLVVTRGFGNGTQLGAVPFIVTSGYDIGEIVVTPFAEEMLNTTISNFSPQLVTLITAATIDLVSGITDRTDMTTPISSSQVQLKARISNDTIDLDTGIE